MKLLLSSLLLAMLIIGGALQAGAWQQQRKRSGTSSQSKQTLSATAQSSRATDNGDDPDLPSALRGIDKSEYLKLREHQIDLLRGIPYNLPYNPRARAIKQMELEEREVKKKDSNTKSAQYSIQASDSGWTPIGPDPIPQGQTNGMKNSVSGRVTAIAVRPDNPNTVYVGTAQGGVYRSLDGGATWTSLFDQAETLAIGALAISPVNPTTVFVGTGEPNRSADSFFGVGLYIIKNAETTADLTGPFNTGSDGSDVFTGNSISKILVDPLDDNVIFVSSGIGLGGIDGSLSASNPLTGLYRSTNALGASPTFTRLDVPPGLDFRTVNDMIFEPDNPSSLICSVSGSSSPGDGGIWLTTNALDASPTFSQVFAPKNSFVRTAFALVNAGGQATIYAATTEHATSGSECDSVGQQGQLRVSTDGGLTWSDPMPSAEGFCGGQCFYDIAVAADTTGRIYLGGSSDSTCSGSLKRSTNGGKAFVLSDDGLHADTHAIAIAPSDPSIIYTGDDGGIFKSTDRGDTWNSLNNPGFSATQFQSIALHPVDPNFSIGGTQDNGSLLFDETRNWRQIDFGDGGYTLIDQNAVNTKKVVLYHTYFNFFGGNPLVGFARVTKTKAAGPNRWTFYGCANNGAIGNGISCSDTAVLFYAPMALGPGNPNTVYFGTDRLYRSTNKGATMKVVSQKPIEKFTAISAIGISPQNDNVRIVGLEDGRVFASTDGSSNMTEVTSPDFPQFEFVARVVIDPQNSNTAYVTFSGYGDPPGQHIWKTTDLAGGGKTWTPAGSGIPDVPVSAFVIDPANSNDLYAGTDIGVFRSTDGGATWTPFSDGLPRVAVFDMAIQSPNRILRTATHGRGLWERAIP